MPLSDIEIAQEDPHSDDAACLMDELSDCLESITGDSGKNSFDIEDVYIERSMFAIARDEEGHAIGCGAIRPVNQSTAEVKRMYARTRASGTGTKILSFLEHQACKMGYSALRLETRLVNERAVSFYEHNGYVRIPNYGKYVGNSKAICFEKIL